MYNIKPGEVSIDHMDKTIISEYITVQEDLSGNDEKSRRH